MFGASIDYGRVKIHRHKYIFFQPAKTAMTPNGEIYFPPAHFKANYSTTVPDTAQLIHELTRIWQHQHGVWVRWRGTLARGKYAYGDLAARSVPFDRFNIEQQAAIVEDYYLTTHNYGAHHGSGARTDYERMIPFLPGKR